MDLQDLQNLSLVSEMLFWLLLCQSSMPVLGKVLQLSASDWAACPSVLVAGTILRPTGLERGGKAGGSRVASTVTCRLSGGVGGGLSPVPVPGLGGGKGGGESNTYTSTVCCLRSGGVSVLCTLLFVCGRGGGKGGS